MNFNISPETCPEHSRGKLGEDDAEDGLIPQTLRPLVEKRLALKQTLLDLDPRDCQVKALKERSAALKWLLVVCFGYLGYKNARFGKIESHEAVTAISRELMLQAKEVAEELGFAIIHMYVDSLFVQKEGLIEPKDFAPLLEAVQVQTGIPIALDGVYKWLAFPPSKRDRRVPVPNRYFGVFTDGEIKMRGIATRKHDTPRFVTEVQYGLLRILSQADNPVEKLPEAQSFLSAQLCKLREGRVPVENLQVAKKLSRALDAYKVLSPAALAAGQLQAQGVDIHPGIRVKFWYVRGGVQVGNVDIKQIDVKRYQRLVELAAEEIFGLLLPIRQDSLPIFMPAQASC